MLKPVWMSASCQISRSRVLAGPRSHRRAGRRRAGDLMCSPAHALLARPARILPPRDLLGEPGDAHEIGIAVAVHVHGQVAEVVVVVVREVQVAELVFRPRRRLVPVLARDDVELPVLVDVGHGCGLARAVIDQERTEGDVRGTGGRRSEQGACKNDAHSAHTSRAPVVEGTKGTEFTTKERRNEGRTKKMYFLRKQYISSFVSVNSVSSL